VSDGSEHATDRIILNAHWNQYLNPSALWILEEVGTRGRTEFAFVNEETGKPYTTITRVWYRIRKKAGLSSKTRLHDLRHTFGKMVLEAGHSLEELRRALSHADARTTLRYSHLSARTMREVALAASVIVKPVAAQAITMGNVSDDVDPLLFAGEAALLAGAGRRGADEGPEVGRAPVGALLISATTMLSFSA
jgi:hypothetical protein